MVSGFDELEMEGRIYALIKDGEYVYIGLTMRSLAERVSEHKSTAKKFDSYEEIISVDLPEKGDERLRQWENFYILKYNCFYNKILTHVGEDNVISCDAEDSKLLEKISLLVNSEGVIGRGLRECNGRSNRGVEQCDLSFWALEPTNDLGDEISILKKKLIGLGFKNPMLFHHVKHTSLVREFIDSQENNFDTDWLIGKLDRPS